MLGVDWELAGGAYRIRHIVSGGAWDVDVRSPLAEPGLGVKEGDYVLAVNGIPLDTSRDPWAAFAGMADQTVLLTREQHGVDDRVDAGGGQVPRATSRAAIPRVDRAAPRRVDKAHRRQGRRTCTCRAPASTRRTSSMRQFMAQWSKDGLIVDERFNSGGQIPDRFIELLNRPMLSATGPCATRRRSSGRRSAHRGPQVMLINGWSGSGGDAFPFYFREAKLGPLDRHAHVGRPHRHQRRAGARRRRRRHGADLPHVRRDAASGSPKGTASIRISRSTRIRRNWPRAWIRSSSARFRKCRHRLQQAPRPRQPHMRRDSAAAVEL